MVPLYTGCAGNICSEIIVRYELGALVGLGYICTTEARHFIKRAIRLPSVDYPYLDFRFYRREHLYPDTIKEPWRIIRSVRWLIGPVFKVIIKKQTNVRYENTHINVDAMPYIKMITAISFT